MFKKPKPEPAEQTYHVSIKQRDDRQFRIVVRDPRWRIVVDCHFKTDSLADARQIAQQHIIADKKRRADEKRWTEEAVEYTVE